MPSKRFPLTNPEGLDFPETLVWLSLAAHLGLCADPSQVCEERKHGVGVEILISSFPLD